MEGILVIDYESLREYWGESRRRRRLSVNKLAAALSEKIGYSVKQSQLESFEYKGTKPNPDTWKAIEFQIDEWRGEDAAAAKRLREEAASYGANHSCHACGAVVPGRTTGAHYCMMCGVKILEKACKACGFVETRPDAEYCVKCGKKLE
jgi:hypothetical protein